MSTSCSLSFQTGGAFTRAPPIGALVEARRLRPAAWNLTPLAEAAPSVRGSAVLRADVMVRGQRRPR